MRPYWKGYLKLALFSCPIALHAACSMAERIAFRQINKAPGNRLRQQLIDEETREPVAPEHKGRGYELAKGQYLIIDDAELDANEIESTHTIEIRLAAGARAIFAPSRGRISHCVAGHVRFELRNVDANYPFESSRGLPGSEPNSGPGDHSRFSCSGGDTQLGAGFCRD